MAEYTRGMEERGRESGEPGRSGLTRRRASSLREEFEGMNFEQNRDVYKQENGTDWQKKLNNGDPKRRP